VALPMRMNLGPIVIEPYNVSATNMDPDFHEPIDGLRRDAPVTVYGQVNYYSTEAQRPAAPGDAASSAGRLIFRKSDLTRAGYTPKKGDKITSIWNRAVQYWIVESRPEAHLHGHSYTHRCEFSAKEQDRAFRT